MKRFNLLWSVILLVVTGNYAFGQNFFTDGANGTFETATSVDDFTIWTNYRGPKLSSSIEVVNSLSYQGNNSFKVRFENNGLDAQVRMDVHSKKLYNFQAGKTYVLRAKVFVPSNGLGVNSGKTRVIIGVKGQIHYLASYFGVYGDGSFSHFQEKSFIVGDEIHDNYDQWVDVYTIHTFAENTSAEVGVEIDEVLGISQGKEVYVDNIEVFELTPYQFHVERDLDEKTITISSVSGGMPGYPYYFFQLRTETSYPYPYNGGTFNNTFEIDIKKPSKFLITQVNPNIPYAALSNFPNGVALSHGKEVNVAAYYGYNAAICAGESITLRAGGAGSGGTYKWYSAKTGGQYLGSGSTYTPPILNTPGVYFYYFLVDYGTSVTTRTEITVTVKPIPVLDIYNLDDIYSFYASPVVLSPYPGGGDLSGAGITDNVFDPSEAGVGTHTLTYSYSTYDWPHCSSTITREVQVFDPVPLCISAVPQGSGEFSLDSYSGRIVYKTDENCIEDIEMGCIQGEVDAPIVESVISASASTVCDDWDYTGIYTSSNNTNLQGANVYETGKRGKWRVDGAYIYNTDAIDRSKNYNTGTFDLAAFNWQYAEVNQKSGWIKSSTIEHYSPNGDALQERNALGIASVVKFGYNDALPYLTAQNATYESVCFESFENLYNTLYLEDGLVLHGQKTVNGGHSGKKSLELVAGKQFLAGDRDYVVPKNTGITIKLWAKGVESGLSYSVGSYLDAVAQGDFRLLSRVGEWSLYQADFSSGNYTELQIRVDNNGTNTIYIDDLRIQPSEAQMSSYVYDVNNLRLLAVFDDQHYGLFYHYNAEGKLVRKLLETERGTQTLQETFYNTPSELR